METSKPSLWKMLRNPVVIVIIIVFIVITTVTRFYRIDIAPAGGDGDVAWMAIEAVDWVDRGVYPYYVDAAHFPAPLVIALMSLSVLIHGVAIETPRLVTAWGSLFIMLMMLPTAWILLADDQSEKRRLLVGLSAMGAAATSLHAMNMARLGVNTTMLPIFITLSLLTAAYAWEYGGLWRWILAGVCLALTQFIYISAHLMGLVAILWFVHAALATAKQFGGRWRGWFAMAATTLLVYLPNLILYLRWSEAFTQRLDTSSADGVEKLIWTHDFGSFTAMLNFILLKLYRVGVHVGFPWESGYLPLSTPILTPLFFAGWLLGIALCLWRFRRTAYGWVLLALPALAMADVLTSLLVQPNPMRQIALMPFHYLVAGYGLGEILLLIIRYLPSVLRVFFLGLIAIVAIVPTVTGFYQYIAAEVPAHYENPEIAWRISQTDLDITERINARPGQSYLLPYGEYTRKNIAWLSFEQFRHRGSILSDSGELLLETLPENLIVIQATDPQRARHTQTVGLIQPSWWVLYHVGHVYFLPPIDENQQAELFMAIEASNPEALIDASDTHIADFYEIETPDSLFDFADYNPLDATFSLQDSEPEVRLTGYTVSPAEPVPGEEFEVSLYWHPLQQIPRNYEIIVQLWDDEGISYGNSHNLPFDATYRTRVWHEDETTVTQHILFLSENMPAGRYHLTIALMQHLANKNLHVTGTNSSIDGLRASASDFRILPAGSDTREDYTLLKDEIHFGDILELESTDITIGDLSLTPFEEWQVEQNATLDLTLQWQVLERPPVDYSLFLHITPENVAQPVLQNDLSLGNAGLPSGAWRAGDYWHNNISIAIPEDLAPGRYEIWMGVYYYADGSRLPIFVENERQSNERLQLGYFDVEE